MSGRLNRSSDQQFMGAALGKLSSGSSRGRRRILIQRGTITAATAVHGRGAGRIIVQQFTGGTGAQPPHPLTPSPRERGRGQGGKGAQPADWMLHVFSDS